MDRKSNTKSRLNIGLLINQIDGRYQVPLWNGIRDVIRDKGQNLYIFAGKALKSPLEEELQHNVIYKLINIQELDGLIITSGTLSNYVGKEDLMAFLGPLKKLPMVSISLPLTGIPSVIIDNKSGMKELMEHFIHIHHFKNIAYIRGPETNPEAEERYQVYRQALLDSGIAIDPEIIFPGDFREFSARDAVKVLLEERKKKVEAIIAANDDMAIAAYRALKEMNINVPEEISLAGFDDIDEARFYSPSITTVKQPIYEQGRKAAELLFEMLEGRKVPDKVCLEAHLIIRQSCGCLGPQVEAGQTGDYLYNENGDRIPIGQLSNAIIQDLDSKGEPQLFIKSLSEIIQHTDYRKSSIIGLQKIVLELHSRLINDEKYKSNALKLDAIIIPALAYIGKAIDQKEGTKKLFTEHLINTIRLITVRINNTYSLSKLMDVLANSLWIAGIKSGYLCLYSPEGKELKGIDWQLPKYSRLVMAYDENNIILSGKDYVKFNTVTLLPRHIIPQNKSCTYVILPLYSRDEHFGYIALGMGAIDDMVYENLREQISIAIQTAILFRRRKIAELELKAALKVLHKSEERYKEMAVLLPTIIIETDLSKKILFLNQAGLEAFGMSESDLSDNISIETLIHPEDRKRLEDYCKKIVNGESISYNEFRLIKRDGSKLVLLSKAIPVYQEKKIQGIRWSAIDIKPFLSTSLLPEDNFFKKYKFSHRESDVLTYLLQGSKIKEMAERMFLAESTIKGHITSIYSKIGVKNRDELFEIIKEQQVNQAGYESFILSLLSKLIRE